MSVVSCEFQEEWNARKKDRTGTCNGSKKAWRDLSEVCISRFRWNARPFTAFTAWQVCSSLFSRRQHSIPSILGVTSVKEFSLPLIVGIIVGFYSSVFLTSSFWYMLGGKNRGVIDEAVNKRKKAESIGKDGAQV